MKKTSYFASSLMRLIVAVALLSAMHHVRLFGSIGNCRFIFSGINGIAPLLHGLLGTVGSVALLSLGRLSKLCGFAWGLPCATISMGLATQASVLVWHVRGTVWGQRVMNLFLPSAAILFFVLHPSSGIGAWYSIFWLIPMVLHLFSDSLFKTALQATFVAHAVGSCLWLVTVPMVPMAWIALMPYVCIERLLYAGMQLSGAWLVALLYKKESFLDFACSFKRAS
ncbi:hypothetical protein JKY79_01805 [Candidatus Babeliales bacterium]|nr:hypothetical protein [Candidatus Babeliales bacterium]